METSDNDTKAEAKNVWVVSIFRYYFGVLKWEKTDPTGLDDNKACDVEKQVPLA